jgi:glycosyltransferase involved in cell wall biosynthesis
MISVVIPACNEEKYLPGCLKSLRAQDYTGEYEIIVADNGSKDTTARIAKYFGACVIPCPEKKSVFYARQVGADAASGDIIVQADADTVYPRHWLSRIAAQFATHPEVVGISGRYRYIDPPGWAGCEYLLRNSVNLFTIAVFRRPLWVSGATFAFRRQAFHAGNGYRELTYSPDQYGISDRKSVV